MLALRWICGLSTASPQYAASGRQRQRWWLQPLARR